MSRQRKAREARSALAASSKPSRGPLRFFVLPSRHLTGTERTHVVFQLPHPKTGQPALYMKADTGGYLELVKFKENQGSWMVDDCVVEQDGSLYLATPLDPLYFVVALLCEAEEGSKPFNMVAAEYPELLRVLGACVGRLTQLCDIVDPYREGKVFYRYNEFLCLRWLTNKVTAVAATLKSIGVPVAAEEDYTVVAYSIIAGYIPEVLACELKSSLGLDADAEDTPPPATKAQSKLTAGQEEKNKEKNKKKNKKKNKNNKKVAAGMSCISSFFVPK